jgi:hypothetical protein
MNHRGVSNVRLSQTKHNESQNMKTEVRTVVGVKTVFGDVVRCGQQTFTDISEEPAVSLLSESALFCTSVDSNSFLIPSKGINILYRYNRAV